MTLINLQDFIDSLNPSDTKDKKPSPWELTLRYSKQIQRALPQDDYSLGTQLLEVEYDEQLVATTQDVFNSWTGRRFINGTEYHGPIYNYHAASGSLYTGSRTCKCSTCQTDTLPHLKAN